MHRTSTKAIVLWAVLGLFVSFTRPSMLPVWGLIIPFILLYFALRYTIRAVVEYVSHSDAHMKGVEKWLPVAISLPTVVVLGLQSIGQLTLRDVIAVILLVLIGYFYVHRNRSRQNNRTLQ